MGNEYTFLKVAETRLAISCNLPSFQKWLEENYSGFFTCGEPHLRCNLHFEYILPGSEAGRSLSMVPVGKISGNGELHFKVMSSSPSDFFWLMLQICLRYAMGTKRPLDLLLHASGVTYEGNSYIFTGASGAGKSTVCKLLARQPFFQILHDEVIAVTRKNKLFSAWSTPLRGEVSNRYRTGAPLRAIFFLHQDRDNYALRLSNRKVAELLCYSLIPPKVVDHSSFIARHGASFDQLLALAEYVPGFELHFKKEPGFWQCIPSLFNEQEIITPKKEDNIWVAI